MENKICDFKNDQETIDKDFLLKNLREVPGDILAEYLSGISIFIEDLLNCKNLIASRDKPNLSKFLIDRLSEDQLGKLYRIVLNLKSSDPVSRVQEIVADTYGINFPTPESISKSQALISHLKSLDIDYGQKSEELATLSWHMHLLSRILSLLNLGGREFSDLDGLLFDKLSSESPETLDSLIILIKGL